MIDPTRTPRTYAALQSAAGSDDLLCEMAAMEEDLTESKKLLACASVYLPDEPVANKLLDFISQFLTKQICERPRAK